MFDLLGCVLHQQSVLEVNVEDAGQQATFMADYTRSGTVIRLDALHAEGPGPNIIGIQGIRLVAQEVMEFLNADVLEIQGAVRTTGAVPGRVPLPFSIRRR